MMLLVLFEQMTVGLVRTTVGGRGILLHSISTVVCLISP